jgi:hypothetical protein
MDQEKPGFGLGKTAWAPINLVMRSHSTGAPRPIVIVSVVGGPAVAEAPVRPTVIGPNLQSSKPFGGFYRRSHKQS